MNAILTNPTFDQLRTLQDAHELRAVVTVDGRTAIGLSELYTHSDLCNSLAPPGYAGIRLPLMTASELLLIRTHDLLVVAAAGKRGYSNAEQHLLEDLATACGVTVM